VMFREAGNFCALCTDLGPWVRLEHSLSSSKCAFRCSDCPLGDGLFFVNGPSLCFSLRNWRVVPRDH
jgi:hypothetical protein